MNPEGRKSEYEAAPAISQPSLGEIIVNSLSEITDSSNGISSKLEELERYLFGDKPTYQGNVASTNDQKESWENLVLMKLDYIKHVILEQHNTLNTISKFHK